MKLLTKIWIPYFSVICQKPSRQIGGSKHFIQGLSWLRHKRFTSCHLGSGRLSCYLEGPRGTEGRRSWSREWLAVQNIISFQLMGGRHICIILHIKGLLFLTQFKRSAERCLTEDALRERVGFNKSGKGTEQGSENQSPEVFTSQPNPPFPKQ